MTEDADYRKEIGQLAEGSKQPDGFPATKTKMWDSKRFIIQRHESVYMYKSHSADATIWSCMTNKGEIKDMCH